MQVGRRQHIKDGRNLTYLFSKPKNRDRVIIKNGDVYDTLDLMNAVVLKYLDETKEFAKYISKGLDYKNNPADKVELLKRIHEFLMDYVQYKKDKPNLEEIKTPSRVWAERLTGVDCDCMSTFVSSTLVNLGLEHNFKVTQYNPLKNDFEHVYVTVPIDDSTLNGKNYVTVDGVIHQFDTEKLPIINEHEKPVSMDGINIAVLDGIAGNNFQDFLLQDEDGLLGSREDSNEERLEKIFSSLVLTREAIAENPQAYALYTDPEAELKMLDYAIKYFWTPERDNALAVLAANEQKFNDHHNIAMPIPIYDGNGIDMNDGRDELYKNVLYAFNLDDESDLLFSNDGEIIPDEGFNNLDIEADSNYLSGIASTEDPNLEYVYYIIEEEGLDGFSLKKIGRGIKKTVSKATKKVTSTVNHYANEAKKIVKNPGNAAKNVANFGVKTVKDTGKKIGSTAQHYGQESVKVVKNPANALNDVRNAGKQLYTNLKNAVEDVGDFFITQYLRYNPVTAAMRNSFLSLMKINMFKLAEKVKWGYATEQQAAQNGVSSTRWSNSVKARKKFEDAWVRKLKGDKNSLKKAILTHKHSKINGLGELGEPITAATIAAWVGIASGILTLMITILKQFGVLKPEEAQEIEQMAATMQQGVDTYDAASGAYQSAKEGDYMSAMQQASNILPQNQGGSGGSSKQVATYPNQSQLPAQSSSGAYPSYQQQGSRNSAQESSNYEVPNYYSQEQQMKTESYLQRNPIPVVLGILGVSGLATWGIFELMKKNDKKKKANTKQHKGVSGIDGAKGKSDKDKPIPNVEKLILK